MTFAGVLGELLITAGVVLLLFVAWQLWIGDWIYSAERYEQGRQLSEEWAQNPPPVVVPEEGDEAGEPPRIEEPAEAERFGNMYVPRWGEDYVMPMAGGVTRANTLDPIGIGHYPSAEYPTVKMPGEVGNFALAGHRTTFGKPFSEIASLQIGDAIVVETEVGWYTYRFRTLEYVQPSEVDVLLDVPQHPEVPANERYITLTACSPRYSLAERIIAYGVFDSFQSRADGPPSSLTEGV